MRIVRNNNKLVFCIGNIDIEDIDIGGIDIDIGCNNGISIDIP